MRIVGDRQRFALGFDLRRDPDSAGLPHERASWGALQVWVAGRNLTVGQANDGCSVLEAEVPLAPVVAWLADKWEPLLHEERLPERTRCPSAATWRYEGLASLPAADDALDRWLDAREAWWSRHGLGSSLPEYRIPDLHIRRVDEDVELSWDDREWRTVPGGIRLIESPGACRLPSSEVARVLFDWSMTVIDALAQQGDSALFAEELRGRFAAHAQSGDPLRRLAWMAGQRLEDAARKLRVWAGVSTTDIEVTLRALLGGPKDSGGLVTPATLPVMLFKSASPGLSSSDIIELAQLCHQPEPMGTALAALREHAPIPSAPEAATRDGYDRALAVREARGLPSDAALTGALDIESVLLPRLGVRVADVRLDDLHVDGVALASPQAAPMVAVNRSGRFSRTAWGRRMTLAHELCHLLFDVGEKGLVGVVSNPWAPYLMERRANAFAAMLLMPACAIDRLLPGDSEQWTPAMLSDAMRELGVGRSSLTWHLHNLGRITGSEREAWLDELSF